MNIVVQRRDVPRRLSNCDDDDDDDDGDDVDDDDIETVRKII